ncbi:MAG: efflux RND transporter periplasmic adaptor subunit [Ferruginibacter sp.]
MNTSIKILFSIVASSVILTACGDNKTETSKTETKQTTATDTLAATPEEVTLTADQYKVAAIELGKVEMRNLSNVIKVNGTIDVEPQSVVSISAPLGGFVKSAGLLPGQAVRKGQVMAVIENAEFINMQQDYLESKSRMTYLQQELKRQQELQKEEINSLKTLQQISSEYNTMVAKMAGLKQKLALIGINANNVKSGNISRTANLYSPISGYVTESNVNRGKYVQPSDVLFELTNKNYMHLALNVFEKDVRKINPGQPIRFALASETDYNREAKVSLIGKSTEEDGTVPVHAHLNISNDVALYPGMYVKAMIETRTEDVPALPAEAIIQSEGKDFIFIQTDTANNQTTFKMIPVVKGIEQEGFVAVTLPSNFDIAKSKVVLKGAYSILSAMKNVAE